MKGLGLDEWRKKRDGNTEIEIKRMSWTRKKEEEKRLGRCRLRKIIFQLGANYEIIAVGKGKN